MKKPGALSGLSRRELLAAGAASIVARPAPSEAAGGKDPAGSWPMYRHDPALTGSSPLIGGFRRRPEVAWSVDLGGPRVPAERIVVGDLLGDGSEQFLALSEDSITCRDHRGRVRWTLAGFRQPNVVAIEDFAGDGTRGILLTTYLAGRVDTFMVSGRSGKATPLWSDSNNFGGHQRYGKLLPGDRGLQIAATSSGTVPPAPWGGHVRLVGFSDGLSRPRFYVRRFVEGTMYAPLILFSDLNADGAAEMVVVSHEEIWTFDPRNGEQLFHAAYGPQIRTYMGHIAAVRLGPNDPHPSLLMINPSIPGFRAVRLDGKTRAETLWKVVTGPKEDQYQPSVEITRAGGDLVYDLAGDGSYQVAAMVTNEHGDRRSHLVILDAATGRRLYDGRDWKITSVDDLDGDGRNEVVLQDGRDLVIARWTGDGFQELSRTLLASGAAASLPSEGDLSRTSGGNAALRRAGPGSSDFLVRFGEGTHACKLVSARLVRGPEVTDSTVLGLPPPPRPDEHRLTWDGKSVTATLNGKETYRYTPPSPQTYLARPPLVADLGGRREVLVRRFDCAHQAVSVVGSGTTSPRVLYTNPYETLPGHVDPAGAGPEVCDLDGDGENELISVLSGPGGVPYCAVLDDRGREKRRFELIDGATLMCRGPSGSLGPGRGRWLLLRMAFGTALKPGRSPIVVAYDGRTGNRLWVRDGYGLYGKNPVMFVPHLPGAVLDYDGDGADDWIVCSENFYGIVSVKDNRDLVGPVTLSDAVPGHWTAYSYPSVGPLLAGAKPALFHHSAYALVLVTDLAGKPIWHHGLTRDTGGAWGMVSDVDGDRQPEVIHVQPDGVIRCFSGEPREGACPSCPRDSGSMRPGPAGHERWSYDVGQPVSRLVSADLDGDGRRELLFGDGRSLRVLGERSGKPRELWRFEFGRRVGEPVIADVDGDGQAEILVAVEDGKLYCLKGEGVSAPKTGAAVRGRSGAESGAQAREAHG